MVPAHPAAVLLSLAAIAARLTHGHTLPLRAKAAFDLDAVEGGGFTPGAAPLIDAAKLPYFGRARRAIVVPSDVAPARAVSYRAMHWNVGTAMPQVLDEVSSIVLGGKMYIVGGMNPPTFAFDLTSYSWTTLAERPLQGNHHGVAVLRSPSGEDEIYLVGGFGGGSEGQMQVYNVTGDSWRIGAELGGHVDGSVNVVAIDNRIYACGGLKLSPIPNTAGVNPETCKRFDPNTGHWSDLSAMPKGVDHAAIGTDGTNIFVFGGRNAGINRALPGLADVQKYSVATNSWSYAASMPFGRGGMGFAPYFDGFFYVMGGETGGPSSEGVYKQVYMFDGNSWFKGQDMITARHGIYPVLDHLNSRIIVAGGGIRAGWSGTDTLEILEMVAATFPNRQDIPYSSMDCAQHGWDLSNRQRTDWVCSGNEQQAGCVDDMNQSDALNHCNSQGARLCSAFELEGDTTIGGGCNLDRKLLWTLEACDEVSGGRFAASGSSKFSQRYPGRPTRECKDPRDVMPFRCCADITVPYPDDLTTPTPPPTSPSPTQAPTTQAPTTQAPATQAPTTQAPTTQAPATQAPSSIPPGTFIIEPEDPSSLDSAEPEATEASTTTVEATGSPSIFSLQTCQDLGWNVRNQQQITSVCGDSMGCVGGMQYRNAEQVCTGAGARLCTALELEWDATKGSGCKLDRDLVWSKDACMTDVDGVWGFYAVAGSTKFGKRFPARANRECHNGSANFPVRCCADVEIPEPTVGAETTAPPTTPPPTSLPPQPVADSSQAGSTPTTPPPTTPPPTTPPPTTPAAPEGEYSGKNCDELGWTLHKKQQIETVCGSSINCVAPSTQPEAAEQCANADARLCTAHELESDATIGRGCQLDRKLVWSKTECSTTEVPVGFFAVAGSSKFAKAFPERQTQECHPASATVEVRCCADVNIDRGFDADSVPDFEISFDLPGDFSFSGPITNDDSSIGNRIPQSFTWENVASPLGTEFLEPQGIAAAGKLWLIGGFIEGRYDEMGRENLMYDPEKNQWHRRAEMPIPGGITHAGQATDGEHIFIVGGMATAQPEIKFPDCQSIDMVLSYSIADNSWSTLPSLPSPRAGGGATYLNGRLHFFGGGTFVPELKFTEDHADHWSLDLTQPSLGWRRHASISLARNHMGAATVGSFIYAVGGQFLEEEYHANQNLVERYDPHTDAWTVVAPMPEAMGHITPGTFASQHGFFVLGGFSNGRYRLSYSMFFYSPAHDAWIRLAAMEANPSQVAGIIDDTIYVQVRNRAYKGQVRWTQYDQDAN